MALRLSRKWHRLAQLGMLACAMMWQASSHELEFGDYCHGGKDDYSQESFSPPLFLFNAPAVPKPAVVSRTVWGCPEGQTSSWRPQYTTVTHLIIHHSATGNSSSDWSAVVRSIWNHHAKVNGWGDVGYNYLIDPNGVIYEGRAGGANAIGAHFSCRNGNTFGVCLIGTYTSVAPSSAALESLKRLLAWKASQLNLNPLGTSLHSPTKLNLPVIASHRDGNPAYPEEACTTTSCPGNALYGLLPGIRTDVDAIIRASGLPQVEALAPTAITRSSAALQARVVSSATTVVEYRMEWAKASQNWGTGTAGVDYGILLHSAIRSQETEFSGVVHNLQPATRYKFRAYARNAAGWSDVAQANVMVFATEGEILAYPSLQQDGFWVVVNGAPGGRVGLWSSRNLVEWVSERIVTIPLSGSLQVSFPAVKEGTIFYKALPL